MWLLKYVKVYQLYNINNIMNAFLTWINNNPRTSFFVFGVLSVFLVKILL
jgi:hypothetical protein